MSPVREGMSGRTAKVKPGPVPLPQGPGGSFRGVGRVKVVCLRQVPAFNTWATAKFFLKRREGAIPRVSLAFGGGPGKDLP